MDSLTKVWWRGNELRIAYREGGAGFGFNLNLRYGFIPLGYYVSIPWRGDFLRSYRGRLI